MLPLLAYILDEPVIVVAVTPNIIRRRPTEAIKYLPVPFNCDL